MFKNLHDPEVTLESSQPYDPWSHPQASATPQSSYEEEMHDCYLSQRQL